MHKVPMTPVGYAALKDEVQKLKMKERPAVVQAIAEARAFGDLSENAEYAAAKERQGFIESRILEIDDQLDRAEVIDPSTIKTSERIVFGATVTLLNCDTDEEKTYQIVGESEADVVSLKLSLSSPLARALVGKEKGNIVEMVAPGGIHTYEVKDIRYI